MRRCPPRWCGNFGDGRVVYLAAAIDAALWSYAYPYQRRMLAQALTWAAGGPFAISVAAPMCVQATFFTQTEKDSRRLVLHLFNGINTTANHGLPVSDVPLREETVPIHGITVRFEKEAPSDFTSSREERSRTSARMERRRWWNCRRWTCTRCSSASCDRARPQWLCFTRWGKMALEESRRRRKNDGASTDVVP